MIKAPGENGWVQSNRSDSRGTLAETFNIDLTSNQGRVRTTRTKLVASGDNALGNFGAVAAIAYFQNVLRVFSGTADNQWNGGNSPFDAFTRDSTSVSCPLEEGDTAIFQNALYASTEDDIEYTTDGTAYSALSASLTAGVPHLLEVFGDRLYVTAGWDTIKSVSSANSVASSGSYTLDLNLGNNTYVPSILMAGTDRLWIGYSVAVNGGKALIVEWDGVTENTITKRYYLDAPCIMAGVMKGDVPYVLDSFGRLLRWDGGTFNEVDRFPLKTGSFLDFNSSGGMDERSIHPRGMAVDQDDILINVANPKDGTDSSTTYFNDFPSGVWAFNEKNGLHHKYSASFQAPADTGTTNLTDYGQYRCFKAGPLFVTQTANPVPGDGGHILFAMQYFADADDASTDITYGLFADDTPDTTQKAGWIVLPKLSSSNFRDKWQDIAAAFSELETTGDLVEIKYRTKDDTPTYFTGTWTGTDRFTTNTDLSAFSEGDEITVVQGKGSGAVAHIRTLTVDAGTEVVLDRDITGVSGTAKMKIERWTKVAKIEDIASRAYSLGKDALWIQPKLYLQWTGPRELYDILVNNTA